VVAGLDTKADHGRDVATSGDIIGGLVLPKGTLPVIDERREPMTDGAWHPKGLDCLPEFFSLGQIQTAPMRRSPSAGGRVGHGEFSNLSSRAIAELCGVSYLGFLKAFPVVLNISIIPIQFADNVPHDLQTLR